MRFSRGRRWLAVCLVAPALFATLVGAGRSEASKPRKPIGTIRIERDDVFLDGKYVTSDHVLHRGRVVTTGNSGKARLELTLKRTQCRVRARTRLIVGPARDVALRITGRSGEVWCGSRRAQGSSKYESPSSRITTKDPLFGLVVRGRATVVKVHWGAVVVAGRVRGDRAVVVTGGQQVIVPLGGDPLEPRPIVLTRSQRAVVASLARAVPRPKDRTPPSVTLLETPRDPATESDATFSFTAYETDVTYECAFDDSPFNVCSAPIRRTFGRGRHTFAVRGVDSAGNVADTVTYAWRIGLTSTLQIAMSPCDGTALWIPSGTPYVARVPGRLLPAAQGSTVRVIHRRFSSGAPIDPLVHTVRTDADGRWEDIVTVEEWGAGYGPRWEIQAFFEGDVDRLPAQSEVCTVRAHYP
jgi:hypothetical protein